MKRRRTRGRLAGQRLGPTPPTQPVWTVTAPDGRTRRFVEVP